MPSTSAIEGRMSSVRTWRFEMRPEFSNGRLMKSGVSAMSSTVPGVARWRLAFRWRKLSPLSAVTTISALS